jgi:DNA-binding winged helix-turn-helix (wHTH) protein/Tol biopolymer transport system component
VTERRCLVFNFADIEVREREFLLIRAEERLRLEPTAFRVLLFLLRNPGRIVSKEEIVGSVWNDVAVSDNSLTRAIAQLRRVLDDDPREPRYILTVPTLGYRFLSEVKAREDGFIDEDAAGEPEPGGTDSSVPLLTDRLTGGPEAGSGVAEEQNREGSSHPRSRAGKILIATTAAVLLLLTAVFLLRGFRRESAVSNPTLPHLAVEQRLTENASDVPVEFPAISADGKYLAYADPTGLYLRQISSGETRRLSLPKDFVGFPPGCWYPDGVHLLVARDPGPSSNLKPSLYKFSILGGEPQEIVNDSWFGSVSPDGSRIAYPSPTNPGELWIIDSDGANARKVVAIPKSNTQSEGRDVISRVVWSPTGQYLAYIQAHFRSSPDPVEPIRSLRIVDPDGAGASVVLNDARLGDALWWGRGNRILFSYREDPTSSQRNDGVYSIQIDGLTRSAAGPPQPITRAEGVIGALSGTADGRRLVVWRTRQPVQVFLSDYDERSRQWNEPRRLILDANENLAYAWTADSRAVFFVSNRNGTWKLFKQAIDETSPEVLVEGRSLMTARLSADGTQVLYMSFSNPDDASSPTEVISKPIAGGTPHVVMQGKGINNFQCATAPSTLCLFAQIDDEGNVPIRVFDLEHGPGRELLKLPHQVAFENGNWSLSSDGSKLAIALDQHRIRFFSIATGSARDVTVKDWPLRGVDWGANSQTVFMPSNSPSGVPVILEVSQFGKAKVVLKGKLRADFGWMIQSPDSRHALVGEYIPTDNNAWIVNDDF